MAIQCQNCDQEIPDEIAMADIVPEGMGVIIHKYSPPEGLGTVEDFYCSPSCLAEEKNAEREL